MNRLIPPTKSDDVNANYIGLPNEFVLVPGVGIAIHDGVKKGGHLIEFKKEFAGKNLIRNANFKVKQNGNQWLDVPASGDAQYIADGWYFQRGGGSKANCAVSNLHRGGESDIDNSLRITTMSGGLSSSYSIVSQRMAGVQLLSGRTVSLSFKAKCSVERRIAIEFGQDFKSETQTKKIAVGQAELKSTWEKYEFTFDVPALPDPYTVGLENNNWLYFWLEAGDDLNARTGGIDTEDSSIDIANVQLEIGEESTEFESRSYQQELEMVQAYYEVFDGLISMHKSGLAVTTDQVNTFVRFAVRKSKAPEIQFTSDFLTGEVSYGITEDGFNVLGKATSSESTARLLTYVANSEISP